MISRIIMKYYDNMIDEGAIRETSSLAEDSLTMKAYVIARARYDNE